MHINLFLSFFVLSTSIVSHAMEVKHVPKNSSEKPVNMLMESALAGNKEKMAAALQDGATLADQDQQGLTAFHHALYAHKHESIDFIMNILEQGGASSTYLNALRIKASLPPKHINPRERFHFGGLAFHPFKNLILTATGGDLWCVDLWNERGEHLADIVKKVTEDTNIAAEFSASADLILTTCGKEIIVSDLTGRHLVTIKLESIINEFATTLSPQNNYILSTTRSTAQLRNMKGELMVTLPHTAPIITACFNHTGTSILTSCSDNKAYVWDLQGNMLASMYHYLYADKYFDDDDDRSYMNCINNGNDHGFPNPFGQDIRPQFSPDDTAILTAGEEWRSVYVWNLKGDQMAGLTLPRKIIIGKAIFSPDSQLVLTSAADGKEGILWNLQGIDVARSTAWRRSLVTFSPGGKRILSCITNKAFLSDLQGNILTECDPEDSKSLRVAHFSPDGSCFVLAGENTASLWDLRGNKQDAIKLDSWAGRGIFSPLSDSLILIAADHNPIIWGFQGTAVDLIISHAIKSGNTQVLERMLSYLKKHGEPLTLYCKKNIISSIIHQAARIHKHNQEVYTRLLHIIQLLIEHTHALLDERDAEDHLPLFWSHHYDLQEIVNLVTKKRSDPNLAPTLQASSHLPQARFPEVLSVEDYFDATQRGNLPLLKKCLANHTIEVDAINSDGFNALHLACISGQLEAIKLLLQQKKVNIHEAITKEGPYHGWTPLHCACFQDKSEIILFLLYAGAISTIADKQGRLPLDLALTQANQEVVDVLLNLQTQISDVVNKHIKQQEANIDVPSPQAEIAECVVCLEPLQERYGAVPCGHTRVCTVCRSALQACPICEKPIEKWIKLFD